MVNFIANYWYLLVIEAIIAFIVGFALWAFIQLPTVTQVKAVKEWLKYAVAWAEKEMGTGTGQLKLRYVYEMFAEKFTWMTRYIPFETFSGYVDEALEWLNNQLESNKDVRELVKGSGNDEETGGATAIGFTLETKEEEEEEIDTTITM